MRFSMAVAIVVLLLPASGWGADIGYFGDSQSAEKGYLFTQLYSSLNSGGNRVQVARSVCGAMIDGYLSGGVASSCDFPNQHHLSIEGGKGDFIRGRGRTISVESQFGKMDLAVIQLGDNHLGSPVATATAAKDLVTKILRSGKGCIWIGPASVGPANSKKSCAQKRQQKGAVSAAIRQALERTVVNGKKCSFVDSFTATNDNPFRGDAMCLHYSAQDYVKWGDAIRPRVAAAILEQTSGGHGGGGASVGSDSGDAGAKRE